MFISMYVQCMCMRLTQTDLSYDFSFQNIFCSDYIVYEFTLCIVWSIQVCAKSHCMHSTSQVLSYMQASIVVTGYIILSGQSS